MKLPKISRTYTPLLLTTSWAHGLITGLFLGTTAGMARMGNNPNGWVSPAVVAGVVVLLAGLEFWHKQRVAKVAKMMDEAQYMDKLFDGGIDVGSPGFDLVTIDREYRA